MQGRFEGLTDARIGLIEPLLPPPRKGPGRPEASFRKVLNTILWVLINGAKRCSVPEGEQRSPKSAAHNRLGKWQEDGTWAKILSRLLGTAENEGMIGWERASADGSFAPGKGGGEDADCGYKGKGLTIHVLADSNGMPLSAASTVGRKCSISPEFPTGNGRVDLHLRCRDRQAVIEVKSFRDQAELEDSREQAFRYADKLKLSEITIAMFVPVEDEDVLKELSWEEIIGSVKITVVPIGWV